MLPRAVLKAPAQPGPAVNWTGLYAGAEFGFDFASAKYVRPQAAQNDIWIGSANRGLVGGVYAGFNYQALPWLVLGVEGDLSSSRANYRELGADIDFLQDSKYLGAVAGRVGIVIMPTTMVYAKAGPSWIDVRGRRRLRHRVQDDPQGGTIRCRHRVAGHAELRFAPGRILYARDRSAAAEPGV
jgi:opacity protein-like surface antigen